MILSGKKLLKGEKCVQLIIRLKGYTSRVVYEGLLENISKDIGGRQP